MPDRVREAVFETLGSRLGTPGKLPAVRVLDVFAGGGGVGLEALSRGAVWCGFVERNAAALKVLRGNLSTVLGDEAAELSQVLPVDAYRTAGWVRTVRGKPVDLAFIDPPFLDSRDATPDGKVPGLIGWLDRAQVLAEDALVVVRHEEHVSYDEHPYGRLHAADVRRYGRMRVTYLTSAGPE